MLDRLTAPEIAEWQAYFALAADENAFESKQERFKRIMRRTLGDR